MSFSLGSDIRELFAPLTVRQWTFRNRIVMPPMVTCRDITAPDGAAWYGRRAAGGAGMVIVEAMGVTDFGTELTDGNLRPLVDAVHEQGALIGFQLFPIKRGTDRSVNELTDVDIQIMIEQYVAATRICRDAGFDAIEPHGAHGFLLNRFFSAAHNHRSDAYGGSPEKRMRLALEIVSAVRDAAGDDLLVLYRHTPVMDGGYDLDASLELARRLVACGVDILDISPSGEVPGELAAPFRACGVPVIAVGRMDEPERATEAFGEGRADLIAVGRGLIADPDWPMKVREGRWEAIVRCRKCDEMCFGNLRRGEPIACTQWERNGRHAGEA